MDAPQVTVVMPALNEEQNIQAAIVATLDAFDQHRLTGELLVIDDGSTDRTGKAAAEFQTRDPRVRVVRHETPQGIGASFWDGVAQARGEAVCMIPGDNENEPGEILRHYPLLAQVDIVVPYLADRPMRSLPRRLLSRTFLWIIRLTFGVSFRYTNGTVLYRTRALEAIEQHSPGFFFQTDILVRMAKMGYLHAQVPYRALRRTGGASKAITWRALRGVIAGYARLLRDRWFRRTLFRKAFVPGTKTHAHFAEGGSPCKN